MKIRHLLLGLLILCAAGTGAIRPSLGYLDDPNLNQTPFLIFGRVLYDGGAPCNSPNVSITNLNTSVAWYADTVSDSNFYQTLLTLADVDAGDVLRWSVTDGAVVNTTNRMVGLGDIESGGIFDFNMILQSIAPRIIGHDPESQIHDVENMTRRFNVTIDQVVDVAWQINGSPIHTNWSVTDASCTYTVGIGVWNISANASNENGTAMQGWIWDVVSATTPRPAAPFVVCGWVNYGAGRVCEEHAVNITNLNTGTRWPAEARAGYSYYELILDSGDVSAGNVLEFNVTDGAAYNTTNRTVDQSDIDSGGIFGFNLTLVSTEPQITGYAPKSPVYDAENATRRFNITIDQVVNVTWLINGTEVQPNGSVADASYTNISAAIGVWNVSARASNENGTAMQEWLWNVTKLLPPNITSFTPSSHVRDTENATQTFGITIDQVVDVTWLINGTEVSDEADVNESSYTNTSAAIGVWNVTTVASNQNGTDMQEWTWYVTSYTPPPSPVFVIYGDVSYDNGSACNSPFTVITNLNTSKELIADNRTGEGFYQLVTSSAFANVSDVLRINAHKNGAPVGNATYTVNQTDIGNGAIKADINKRCLPDFTVADVSFDEPLLIGDLVTINATITNSGEAEGETSVEFYDNKSITIERSQNDYPESPINDTVTLPDIIRIRVHFESSGGNITIYNESHMVERITRNGWTEWCDGDTIRIESLNAAFTVDRYEAVLANESITLGKGDSVNVPAVWDLSDQCMGWATNGNHNITVGVDPYDQVIESNETNNTKTEVVNVIPSLDFAVTNISLSQTEPVLGDVVGVDANITNHGVRNGMAVVRMCYDNRSAEIGRALGTAGTSSTDIISLPPGVLGARLHFKSEVCNGEVSIYDGDGGLVERIAHRGGGQGVVRNYKWTDWIYGEKIAIVIDLLPQQYLLSLVFQTNNTIWDYDLNNGTIPEEFKDTIEELGYSLSDNATVEKEQEDEWTIIDGGRKSWCIRNDQGVRMSCYQYTYCIHRGEFTIDRYEALIAEEPVTLNATESKVISVPWRTGAAYGGVGDHNITVVVDPHNHTVETNETNNTLIEQVSVNGTNLAVTAIGTSCGFYPDRCYVGQDVNVATTIANIGAADATNFTVVFLDGICSDHGDANISDNNFTNFHIERLNSGESRNISVIWNPLETGWHTITASIPYDNTDNNETNNELFGYAEVEPFYDFVVESVSVEPQTNVRRGESVDITATIGNSDKGHGGGNVSIAFFVNSTDFAGTSGERFIRIKTIDDVYVGVGETETVFIEWDVDVAGGCHLMAAVANPDEEVEEIEGIAPCGDGILFRGETGNNVKNCILHVNPLDIAITNIVLVPADPNIGDIVDISAEIRNNGSTDANSTVWFYMEKDLEKDHSQSLILQPEEVMMRVNLDIKINNHKGGEVTASVNDREGDDRPVNFYAKCVEYGGQDMEVRRFEGEETDCYYTTEGDGYRYWDDVWTEWVNGTAIEINTEGNARVSIDKYQVRLGNETVTLGPGESMVYHSTWNTSPPLKAGEYYRGRAGVENRTSYSNDTYLGGTDLAITDLSVRSPVYDGDKVWVNATIGNLGSVAATDFLVNFTEVYDPEDEGTFSRPKRGIDNLELINTTYIESLDAGSSINIMILWNASIRDIKCEGQCLVNDWEPCTWYEIADDYNIRVEINPLENEEKEEADTNHTIHSGVHVDKSRDFNIMDISFRVTNEYCNSSELTVYDDVTLNATLDITNLANQGGVVNVSFYIDVDDPCDTHKIGNTTVAFPAGNGTGYAEIEWTVDSFGDVDIIGSHNMTVVADPENRIYEIDDVNNRYIQPIQVKAPDLEVESLQIHPVNPDKNETVSIEVTIANYGGVDAGNVTLTIYDWAERHIEDVSEQTEITMDDAAAMRLYLEVEVEGGSRVCVNDRSGREIVCYHENFYGWTPWVVDNSATIVVMNNGTDVAYAEVSKIYYLESSSIIHTSTHDLGINETEKITVNQTLPVGERLIAAIIDPEGSITEHNKSNNRLTELVQVQTADFEVSDLSLTWRNGTGIGKNEIVKDGDDVRISANITNIGVEATGSFDVRFFAGDLLIESEVEGDLAPNESVCVSTNWSVTVGNHLLKVEADYENAIDETNETNNIATRKMHVRGAKLSGNTSWETLGLHGEILFGPDQPYDEDEVIITATINNSGCVPATDFNIALFFDYAPDLFQKICGNELSKGSWWVNETYSDAEYLYLKVTTPASFPGSRVDCRHIVEDDVIVYDGNDSEVARPVAEPYKPCWVMVNGDTVNVRLTPEGSRIGPVFNIEFYPIYQNGTSMLFEGIDVPVNSSRNLLMKRNVSAGDYTIMLLVDPENKVPEEEAHRKYNTISRIVHVKPTRDFTVTNVTGDGVNLSDLDTPTIIADVSNIGLRNGTADVSFVDYEVEHRTYKYHFDINRSPSYLPILPDVKLLKSGYDDLMIIHRPGVDAIDLHFDMIYLPRADISSPAGVMAIYDEKENMVWSKAGSGDDGFHCDGNCEDANIHMVPGETAYIYTNRYARFDLGRYTTETEFHRDEVRLNASKTCNESKNITPTRAAYTGDHAITVTLDGDNRISEISESNNKLSSSLLHVNASRDPAVVGLNITPENPEEGEDVDITAVIANNGSKSSSFTVDLWANLTRKKPEADESLPEANLTTMSGDRVRYITLLKHANLTLAPGENTTVNATWDDISIAGDPTTHHIIAIVDPTDEIDEIDESNNEIVKKITPDYPDLTIGTAHVQGGTRKAVVPIIELCGASGASDITVRFESSETEKCSKSVHGWDECSISHSHQGASNMQVLFNPLRADPKNGDGYVIVNDRRSSRNYIKKYRGVGYAEKWSPWVEGDKVWIISGGAGTVYAKITKYRWGNTSDKQIDYLPAGGREYVEMPSWEYECPRMVNITVDPDDNITEINEGNNEGSVLGYADLRAEGIRFVSPTDDKLCLDAEKFEIKGTIANRGDEGGRIFPVSDFNVTLEFRKWHYSDGTDGDAVFNITKHVEGPLDANEELTIQFEFDPSEKFDVGGNYSVFLIADSSGDICESSELYYPDGEYNNDTRYIRRVDDIGYDYVRVYNTSGYTGGGELINVAQGEVNGRVVYTVGDYKYGGMVSQGGTVTVRYADTIPDDIDPDDIEFARLFLYWYTWTDRPDLAGADTKFNGHSLVKAGNYSDNPGAAEHDCGYGLYSYDVTDYVNSGENEATMTTTSELRVGVQAIGLLVVYKDEDEPLTKYWINEGADVQLAKNRGGTDGAFDTGLPYSECIAYARFKDVESDDIEGVNATLMTILGMNLEEPLYPDAGGEGDRMWFNNYQIGTPLAGTNRHYWEHLDDSSASVTKDRWEDVTDHLKKGDNEAEMGSRGNFIMPANAFLRLIFPPDLAIINLTAPASTVVGAHHSINVTIRNDGRSDAHDFNVTFYIDEEQIDLDPLRLSDHRGPFDLAAGENMTLHLHNWTPMLLMHVYNLTAAVDVLSGEDWTEIETDNNAMTKRVPIEEGGFGNQTGPRGTGGSSNPTGGEYTEPITGRVLQGITELIGGGGGGAGMFSLTEWIMKGAVWLVLLLFVGLGYRMEQRGYEGVSGGYAGDL